MTFEQMAQLLAEQWGIKRFRTVLGDSLGEIDTVMELVDALVRQAWTRWEAEQVLTAAAAHYRDWPTFEQLMGSLLTLRASARARLSPLVGHHIMWPGESRVKVARVEVLGEMVVLYPADGPHPELRVTTEHAYQWRPGQPLRARAPSGTMFTVPTLPALPGCLDDLSLEAQEKALVMRLNAVRRALGKGQGEDIGC